MTQPNKPLVSQRAREAAARWAKSNSRHAQAANIKRGSCDTAPIVQAFARFEAETIASLSSETPMHRWDDAAGQYVRNDTASTPSQSDVIEKCALRDALEKCRAQFEFYVAAHLAKQPPDMDKAATNQEFVELCDAALASQEGQL